MITVFQSRTRREQCLDDVPAHVKRRRGDPASDHMVHVATTRDKPQSQNKLRRMMEKEIPYEMIPQSERHLYHCIEKPKRRSGSLGWTIKVVRF